MKNSIKKFLSVLFCILICICSVSFVFAEHDAEEAEREKIEEDFDIINTVSNSDSYTFNKYPTSSSYSFNIKFEVTKKAGQKDYIPGTVAITAPIEKVLRELHCYNFTSHNPSIKVVCPKIDGFSNFKVSADGIYEAFNIQNIEAEDTFTLDGEFQVTIANSSGTPFVFYNNKTVEFSVSVNKEYAKPIQFIADIPLANFTNLFALVKPKYDLANGTDHKVGLSCSVRSSENEKAGYRNVYVKFILPADSELITDVPSDEQGCYSFTSSLWNHNFYAELKLGSSYSNSTVFSVRAIFYARKTNCGSSASCEHDAEELEEIYSQTVSGTLNGYVLSTPEYSFDTSSQGIDKNELSSMDEATVSYSSSVLLPLSATNSNGVVRYKFAGLAGLRPDKTAKEMLTDEEYEVKGVAYFLRDMNTTLYSYESTIPTVHIRKAGSSAWEVFTPNICRYTERENKNIRMYTTYDTGAEYFIEFPSETVEYYLDFPGISNGLKDTYLYTCVSLKIGNYKVYPSATDPNTQGISGIFGLDVINSTENSIFSFTPMALRTFSNLKTTHNLENIEKSSPSTVKFTKFYSVCSNLIEPITYSPLLTSNISRTFFSNTQKYRVTITSYLSFLNSVPLFTDGGIAMFTLPDGFELESAEAPYLVEIEKRVINKKNVVFLTLGPEDLSTGSGYAKSSNFILKLITTKEPTEYNGNYSFKLEISDFTPANYSFENNYLTKTLNLSFTPPSSSKQAASLFRKTSDTEYTLDANDETRVATDLLYNYKLKFYAVTDTYGLVLYDNLDNSEACNSVSHWSGSFMGIDTSDITEKGFSTRIRYSPSSKADIFSLDTSWFLYNEEVDKANVKSIAIEILDNSGNPVKINAGTSLFAEIQMKAPENYPNTDLAYNDFRITYYTEENSGELKMFGSNTMKTGINEVSFGKLTATVVDENNSPVLNSVFGIYDKDGILVDRFVSGENAYENEGIPAGTYTIKQISAPNGYMDAEPEEFSITIENLEAEVTLINKLKPEEPTAALPESGTFDIFFLILLITASIAAFIRMKNEEIKIG